MKIGFMQGGKRYFREVVIYAVSCQNSFGVDDILPNRELLTICSKGECWIITNIALAEHLLELNLLQRTTLWVKLDTVLFQQGYTIPLLQRQNQTSQQARIWICQHGLVGAVQRCALLCTQTSSLQPWDACHTQHSISIALSKTTLPKFQHALFDWRTVGVQQSG